MFVIEKSHLEDRWVGSKKGIFSSLVSSIGFAPCVFPKSVSWQTEVVANDRGLMKVFPVSCMFFCECFTF